MVPVEDSSVDEINLEGSMKSTSSYDSDQNSAEGTLLETASLTDSDYSTPSISIATTSSPLPTRCVSDPNLLRHRHGDPKRPSLCILPEESTKIASVSRCQRQDCIDHATGERHTKHIHKCICWDVT